MKTYTAYWRDGKKTSLTGNTIAEAFNNAGYGAGAIRALDFWSENDPPQYQWDAIAKEWRNIEIRPLTTPINTL